MRVVIAIGTSCSRKFGFVHDRLPQSFGVDGVSPSQHAEAAAARNRAASDAALPNSPCGQLQCSPVALWRVRGLSAISCISLVAISNISSGA